MFCWFDYLLEKQNPRQNTELDDGEEKKSKINLDNHTIRYKIKKKIYFTDGEEKK